MTDREKTCRAVCGTDTPCKNFCDYAKNYYKGLIAGRKEREDEIKQVEQVNENRGAFIDWCALHHEEILKEYTGFLEAAK